MDNRTHFAVGSGQFINNDVPFLEWVNFDVLTHLQDLGQPELFPLVQTNQDGILLDFGYKLNTLANAKVTSLQISLVANNATTGERWEFDRVNISLQPNLIQTNGVQIVDSESSRNYRINSNSPYNLVSLESTHLVGTEQFYEGVVAQKITWQDYIRNNNVASIFFNTFSTNNNLNQKASNYSNSEGFSIHLLATAIVEGNDSVVGQSTQTIERLSSPINVYDYFESDDGVVTAGDIQIFDETETFNLGNEFVLGSTILFRTEWSGPSPLDIADLGYVLHSFEPKEANSNLQIEESSTFRGVTEGGALSQVLAVQDGANVVSRCFIDTSLINLQDYTLSARIQTPGLPSSIGYALLDFKSLNGRNIVFTARVDIFAGSKVFSSLNNEVTTADLRFRIGDSTAALNDANNAGWGAFTEVTWATFVTLAIPAGVKVRCQYIGSSTVADLPARIKCVTNEAVTATVTNTIFTSNQVAANDVLLATETEMISSLITSQFASLFFSNVRTDLEIANSSDLTDFVAGIGSLSPMDLDATGHLFVAPTTSNKIGQLSIQTTSTDASLGNIIGIASPLQNFGYPLTGNGANVEAYRFEGINDAGIISDVTTFDYFDPYVLGNTYVRYTIRFRKESATQRLFDIVYSPPQTRFLFGNFGANITFNLLHAGVNFGADFTANLSTGVNYTLDMYIPTIANTSISLADYFNSFFVFINGKRLVLSGVFGRATIGVPTRTVKDLYFGSNPSVPIFSDNRIGTFAVERTNTVDLESVRRRYLGLEETTPYKWNFGRIGDLVANEVPPENLGTPITIALGSNTPSNFFV
jgi:hypothetical protein